MPRRHRPLLPALALVCACNGGQADASGFGTPSPTTVPANTTGESSTGSTGSSSTGGAESTSSSSTSSGSTTPVLDMAMPDFGPGHPVGCQGKIDFLFVISAAGTMQAFQERLIESFPGFIAAIEQQVSDFDVHILVANVDTVWGIPDCSVCSSSCDPQGSPPLCGAAVQACDEQLGAGVTFPRGSGASNQRCALAGGNSFITRDEPGLADAFACVARVGLSGGSRTAEAMLEALGPELNGPGGCQEGFLRDDALLVVTIINDGYDVDSAGSAQSWIDALRAAKHEDDDAFAVLVLTTDVDVGPWELCLPGEYSPNKNPLRLLADGVNHGLIASICEESYAPFFVTAVDSIVSLCEGFVVPQ